MARRRRVTPDMALYGALAVSVAFFGYRFVERAPGIDDLEWVVLEQRDPLDDVSMGVHDRAGDVTLTTTLLTLVSDARTPCSLLVFFNPLCPLCDEMATVWGGVERIERGEMMAVVRWITVAPQLEENQPFMQGHLLPEPMYSLPGMEQGAAIGVDRWPIVYLVRNDGVFLGHTERKPENVRLGQECSLSRGG